MMLHLSSALLRGYYTPNQKLACFMKKLWEMINTYLKNTVCILKSIFQGTKKQALKFK